MAIVVDVKVADSKATDTALGRLEKAIEKIDAAMNRLNSTLLLTASTINTAATSMNSAAGNLSRSAQVAQRVSRARTNQPGSALGALPPPIQSWENVREAYRPGAMAGDDFAAKKFMEADRKLKARERARKLASGEGPTLDEILSRTRFASIFGMPVPMPLGRDLKHLGGLAGIDVNNIFSKASKGASHVMPAGLSGAAGGALAIGGLLLFGKAVLETAKAVVRVTEQGYQQMKLLTDATNRNGGSPGQALGASAAASGLGLSPEAIAALGARIGSDSIARMIAAKAGIPTLRGYYGDTNDSEAFRRAILYLAGQKSYEDARREAIGLGEPGLAKVWWMNPDLLHRMAYPSARGVDANSVRSEAMVSGEMAVFNGEMAELQRILGGPGMKAASLGLRQLSTTLEGLNIVLENALAPIKNWLELADILDRSARDLARGMFGGDKTDKVIDELKGINKGINSLKDGTYGGGPRANGSKVGPRGGPNNEAFDRAIKARELGSGII